MGYLLALALIIGVTLSGALGALPLGSWWDSVQSNVTGMIAPKSDREILIENIKKQSAVIERVLRQQSDTRTNPAVSPPTARELEEALDAAEETTTLLNTLQESVQQDQTISTKVIERVLGISPSPHAPVLSPSPSPNCSVVCEGD